MATSTAYVVSEASTYPWHASYPDLHVAKFSIKLQQQEDAPLQRKEPKGREELPYFMFIIDCSGSMFSQWHESSPISALNQALLVDPPESIRIANANADYIGYGSSAKNLWSYRDGKELVSPPVTHKFNDMGGTDFQAAFAFSVQTLLEDDKYARNGHVLFLTDGGNTGECYKENLRLLLSLCADRNLQFHLVGQGHSYDKSIVDVFRSFDADALTVSQTLTSHDIKRLIDTLADVATYERLSKVGTFEVLDEAKKVVETIKIHLPTSDHPISTTSTILRQPATAIRDTRTAAEYPMTRRSVDPNTGIDEINCADDMAIERLTEKLIELKPLIATDPSRVRSILNTKVSDIISGMRSKSAKCPRTKLSALMTLVMSMRQAINENLTAGASDIFTAVEPRTATAYDSLSGRLKRITAERLSAAKARDDANAELNAIHSRELETLIEAISANYVPGVDPDPKDYVCPITCANYTEAVMGLAIKVRRHKSAVVNPSNIVIEGASQIMSAEAFRMAMASSLADCPETINEDVAFRGVLGMSPFNGFIPLYITPSHWAAAKMELPKMLGYTCCMSELLYTKEQESIIPALVLEFLARSRETTEFNAKLYVELASVCRELYRNEPSSTLNYEQGTVDFETNPSVLADIGKCYARNEVPVPHSLFWEHLRRNYRCPKDVNLCYEDWVRGIICGLLEVDAKVESAIPTTIDQVMDLIRAREAPICPSSTTIPLTAHFRHNVTLADTICAYTTSYKSQGDSRLNGLDVYNRTTVLEMAAAQALSVFNRILSAIQCATWTERAKNAILVDYIRSPRTHPLFSTELGVLIGLSHVHEHAAGAYSLWMTLAMVRKHRHELINGAEKLDFLKKTFKLELAKRNRNAFLWKK